MRTSTVVFLVLFLCFASSSERRQKVARAVHRATGGLIGEDAGDDCRASRGAIVRGRDDSPEARALRARLEEVLERRAAAERAHRAVDRGAKSIQSRIRALETEAGRHRPHVDVFAEGLDLLRRQYDELSSERDQIVALLHALEGEAIRVRTQLDVAHARGERRAAEDFLRRGAGADPLSDSPLERLARDT